MRSTRPVTPDLGHTLSDTLSSRGEHHGLSARAVSPAAICVSQHGLRKTAVALSYVAFKNTCNNAVK